MLPLRAYLAIAVCFALCVVALAPGAADARTPAPKIAVLSNRADLVSGGDALVRVTLPAGVTASRLRLTAGGRDVTNVLVATGPRQLDGLVTGMPEGRVALVASIRGTASTPRRRAARHRRSSHRVARRSPAFTGRVRTVTVSAARLYVTNHPIGGPVFAGPQIQPWTCAPGGTDAKCDRPPTYQYYYLPKGSSTDGAALPGTTSNSSGGSFQPYDPNNPPSDDQIATTTTTEGVTVRFIVRLEEGYIDRDEYAIAPLFDPGKPWTATAPQRQFNHRLVVTHGFSCDTTYASGDAPSVLEPKVIGGGFIVMSNALDHAGHNCNLLTQAESLVMTKEYTIDHYGTARWTIGSGCSGGSLVQQQVANAYPGIYQGITPQCSFPDAWSTGQQLAAYHFDRGYFENPAKWGTGIAWTPTQIAAVEGHPNHVNAIVFDSVYWTSLADPSDGCAGVPESADYDAQTNPDGVRCTLADYMINVFGPRPERYWTPPEQQVGHGFAGLPIGDVGVQFGLDSLMKGDITPAQFVDLNTKVGGADIDLNPTPERSDTTE